MFLEPPETLPDAVLPIADRVWALGLTSSIFKGAGFDRRAPDNEVLCGFAGVVDSEAFFVSPQLFLEAIRRIVANASPCAPELLLEI